MLKVPADQEDRRLERQDQGRVREEGLVSALISPAGCGVHSSGLRFQFSAMGAPDDSQESIGRARRSGVSLFPFSPCSVREPWLLKAVGMDVVVFLGHE